MKQRRTFIRTLICIWIISLYIAIGRTSFSLSVVSDLQQAASLLTLKGDFMVNFVITLFDYSHLGMGIVPKLLLLPSVASYAMLALSIVFIKDTRSKSLFFVLFGPFALFALNLGTLGFVMNSYDVAGSIALASGIARISFFLSIIGALLTIVFWACASVESSRSINYNEDTKR